MFGRLTTHLHILLLTCVLTRRCKSWVQPVIGIQPGFLDIYSTSNNYVNGRDIITGHPYTLDIHMTGTDQYDYLLELCTYNDKYHFVDQNSCLVFDDFFQQMWENDRYRLQGAQKRTFIHFISPEPLVRLQCNVRVLQCCGCAERACERNIGSSTLFYPQQVINLAISNEPSRGALGGSMDTWPWWIWLLLILALVLLLCLIPLLIFLCSRLCKRKQKVVGSKAMAEQQASIPTPQILARSQEMNTNAAKKPAPQTTKIFRRLSDSPTESLHSTASQSRVATVIRQQPRVATTHWAKSTSDMEMARKPVQEKQTPDIHHLHQVIDESTEVRSHHEVREREGGYRSPTIAVADTAAAASIRERQDDFNESNTEQKASHYYGRDALRLMHQQTTSEEKFFKKNDRQRGLVEEGYDRAQYTYTTPATHFSHSELV
ncbi:unnamed protein product [Thelazia callipaeda]|uniref:CX domain-containing protein n=1 Tax=Thelazia callipaeda TaxID=103827 RepID=A0A0N5D2E8_THECL|nr:unnamed protein product [Thelazia callipaeda]